LRGDLGLFSFGAGKPLSTFEGGVLVTNSSDIYEQTKAYRDKKMNESSFRAQVKRWTRFLTSYLVFRRWIYDLWHWYRAKPIHHVRSEFNLPPDYMPSDIAIAYPDFQARVGLVQLRKLDRMLTRRRTLAKLYNHELRGCPGIHLAPLVDNATYAYYTLRVPRRDETGFRRRMFSRGVGVDQVYNYALPHLKPYRSFARKAYPHATQVASEVINLPCYPDLSEAQARYIAACVRDCAYEIDR
jgi:dTDP-4-amino-4,6-dideoxygalactose transaminase